ncbi:hypothetical protein ACHAXA_008845 [Cyclostephanos tholiformis]|uniref:UDP-N-acetylglucosamine transferase subunit ALG13 n=1 Tax=Cyclostephanos tholiformis TaxID=382380 RepID=A0ABD3SFT5_9STRA
MKRADAILCHAGAGTLLEALEISSSALSSSSSSSSSPPPSPLSSSNAKNDNDDNITLTKIVVAVINANLMDNHQSELAEELERLGHVYVSRDCVSEWTTESGSRRFWEDVGTTKLVPFYPGGIRGGVDDDGVEGYVSGFQLMVDRVMGFGEDWNGKNISKTR